MDALFQMFMSAGSEQCVTAGQGLQYILLLCHRHQQGIDKEKNMGVAVLMLYVG
jgi:hypothetical protein